jgi:hypothetical protein
MNTLLSSASSASSPPGTLFLEKVIAEYQLDSSSPHARMEGFASVTPSTIILLPLHQRGSYLIHYKWNEIRYVEPFLVSPHDAGNIFPNSMRNTNSKKSASRLVFHMWMDHTKHSNQNTSTVIFLSLWIPSDRSPLFDFISRAMHVFAIRSLLGLSETLETTTKAQADLGHCNDAIQEILHARSLFSKRISISSSTSDFDEAHLQFASSLKGCSRMLTEIAEEGLLLSRSHREAFFSSSLPALLADVISNEYAAAEHAAKTAIQILSGKFTNKSSSPPSLIALQVARFVFLKSALSMLHFGCLDSDGMFGRRQLLSNAVLPGLFKSASSDPSPFLEVCLQLASYSPTKEARKKNISLTSSSFFSSASLMQENQEAGEDEAHLGPLRSDGVPVTYGSLSAKEAHALGLPLPSRLLKQIEPFLDPYAEGLTTPGGLSASIRTRRVASHHHQQQQQLQQQQLNNATLSSLSTQTIHSSENSTRNSFSNTARVLNTGVIHLPTVNHTIGAHHHSVLPFDYSQVDLGRIDVQAAIQKHASGLFEGRLEALDSAKNDSSPSSSSQSSSYYPRPSSPELIGHQKAIGLKGGGVLELPLHMPAGLAFRTLHEKQGTSLIESVTSPITDGDFISDEDDGGQRSTPLKTENSLKDLKNDSKVSGTMRSKSLQIPSSSSLSEPEYAFENSVSHLALEGRSTVIEIKEISVSLLVALAPILSLKGSSDTSQGPLATSFLKHGHDSSSTSKLMNHRISMQDTQESWATENLHPDLHLPYKGADFFSPHENDDDDDDETKADKHDNDIGEIKEDHEFDEVRYFSSSILSTSILSSNDVGIGEVLMNNVGDGHKIATALALRVANTIAKLLDIASKAKSSHMAFAESINAAKKSTTKASPLSNTLSMSMVLNGTATLESTHERKPYDDSYQSSMSLENAAGENERLYRNPAKFAVRLLTYSSLLALLTSSPQMRKMVGKDIFKLLRLRCLNDQLELILHTREPVLAMAARNLQSICESLSVWVQELTKH